MARKRRSRRLSNEEKADAAAARAQLEATKKQGRRKKGEGARSRRGSNKQNKPVDFRTKPEKRSSISKKAQNASRRSSTKSSKDKSQKAKYKVNKNRPGLRPPDSGPKSRGSARSNTSQRDGNQSHRSSTSNRSSTRRSSGDNNWRGNASRRKSPNRTPRRSKRKSQRGDTPERSVELPPLSEVTRDPEEPVVFVGNIPHEANRNDIIRTFIKYCADEKIRACKMPTQFMKHLGMRHHRGFCFIVLKTHQDLACILDMHQTDGIFIEGFEGVKLTVKSANQKQDMPNVEAKRKAESRKRSNEDQLFFGALPWAANEQDIREFCEKHGEVEQLFMPRWPTNHITGLQKHKGYCFVRFSSKTFANAQKLADKKEHFLERFPNIPIKVNIAKDTQPDMPRSKGAIRERMAQMYNPYFHPAAHLFPSALPMDVYKRIFGNKPAPPMVFPTPEELALFRQQQIQAAALAAQAGGVPAQ